MNKKAAMAKEALIILITVVLTSALVFGLVKFGVVNVQEVEASNTGASMLNAEFMPFGRSGNVVIQNFRFCDYFASLDGCKEEVLTFYQGEEVYFFFEIVTNPFNGDIILVENYRLRAPNGKVILEVEEKNNYYFELSSNKDEETIFFTDYFVLGRYTDPGEYALDLVVKNSLLDKEVTFSQTFQVEESLI